MADRKKLFFIINRLVLGGHSADAFSLAHRLAGKYDITIVYGEKETDEIEVPLFLQNYPDVSFLKIASLHRSIRPLTDVAAYRQLLFTIKKHRPHIVHTHGFKSGLLGRLAAKQAGVPVIIHTYHGHLFHSYYNRFISSIIIRAERALARLSTRIIAISPQQAFELSQVYRIAPAEKISTIFLGIDKGNYELSARSFFSLKKEYNVPENAIVVAIIGRLVAIKNLSFFVCIAEKILPQQEQVYFFIIGDGNQKSAIQKQLTQQHRLIWQEGKATKEPARIIFTSWITDIVATLPDIDIVILTSLNEGTPVSLIEAQLFGKPVVTMNVGGVKDTILDGETGFLIDKFDADEFVKKLQMLIDDKNLRNTMGNRGKTFAAERFSKEKEVAAIDQLYTDCLHEKNSTQ